MLVSYSASKNSDARTNSHCREQYQKGAKVLIRADDAI